MLTQWPAPDPKCKLNISSFLTVPCPFDCIISAWDIMIIALLLHIMGDGKVGGRFSYARVWVSGIGVGSIVFLFFVLLFCFCAFVNCSVMAGT